MHVVAVVLVRRRLGEEAPCMWSGDGGGEPARDEQLADLYMGRGRMHALSR